MVPCHMVTLMSPFLTDVATTGCTAVPVSFDSCVSYLPCDGVGGGEFLVSCSSHWQNVSIRTQLWVWVAVTARARPRGVSAPCRRVSPPRRPSCRDRVRLAWRVALVFLSLRGCLLATETGRFTLQVRE